MVNPTAAAVVSTATTTQSNFHDPVFKQARELPKGAAAKLRYPGAINPSEYDSLPSMGYTDWLVGEADRVPEGNPHDFDRIRSPQAPPPCVDGDAVNYFDGDELNTYHARSRNIPERTWTGIMEKKQKLEPYLSEELAQTQDRVWWGRHEF